MPPDAPDDRSESRLATYVPQSDKNCDQLAFHQATTAIRLITGGTGSGKTASTVAELAAFIMGPPYPDWYARQHLKLKNGQDAIRRPDEDNPLLIWIIVQKFPKEPRLSGPLAKLWYGENSTTEDGGEVFYPPMIPKSYRIKANENKLVYHVAAESGSRKPGAVIEFKSAEQALDAFEGARVDAVLIDEPISTLIADAIQMRLSRGARLWCVAGLTPYDQSFEWIDRWLNDTTSLVKSFVFHTPANKYQDRERSEAVQELIPEAMKETRIYGKPLGMTGLVYPDIFLWKHPGAEPNNKGNWIEPFKIPDDWTRYAIHDPGTRNAFVMTWFAVAPWNDIFAYKCYFAFLPGSNIRPHFLAVRERNGNDRIRQWIIDPYAGKKRIVSADNGIAEKNLLDMVRELTNKKVKDGGLGMNCNWVLGPTESIQSGRTARALNTQMWLNPLEPLRPMLWLFDLPEFKPAKQQLRLYKWKDAGKQDENKRENEVTRRNNDDFAYCIETGCAIPLKFIPQFGEFNWEPKSVEQNIHDTLGGSAVQFYEQGEIRKYNGDLT